MNGIEESPSMHICHYKENLVLPTQKKCIDKNALCRQQKLQCKKSYVNIVDYFINGYCFIGYFLYYFIGYFLSL